MPSPSWSSTTSSSELLSGALLPAPGDRALDRGPHPQVKPGVAVVGEVGAMHTNRLHTEGNAA